MMENIQEFVSIITKYILLKSIVDFIVCNAQILGLFPLKSNIFIVNDKLLTRYPIPIKFIENLV